MKYAGYFALPLLAGLLAGAWLLVRTSGVESVKAAAPTNTAPDVNIEQQYVVLTDKQAANFKIMPAEQRSFKTLKNAVGSIDFNQNMLVQAFTPNPGRIVDTFFNVGDEVKKGDALFTIDSPDLLQAESGLLASAGVLELQTRTLARVKQLLKTGGGAQKDVDQATSDQQTAEGNFKAGRDAVRLFGKTDAEIDRIVADRKVDSILVDEARTPLIISGPTEDRSDLYKIVDAIVKELIKDKATYDLDEKQRQALLTELGLSKAQLLANTALLTQVLTYHVLPARVLKADVPVLLTSMPVFAAANTNFLKQSPEELGKWAVSQLVRGAAARVEGEYLLNE